MTRHARPNLANAFMASANELEQTLADIWQELLGVSEVGIYDDFFSLGGHSLLMTQLSSRLRETFDVDVPLHTLLEKPTIAALATEIEEILLARIESMSEADADTAVRTARQGTNSR